MNCKYCFYIDEMKNRSHKLLSFMQLKTYQSMLQKAFAHCDRSLTITYQGGEPMLWGLEAFKKALNIEKILNISRIPVFHNLQTNGTLINEDWTKFFKENNFLIGISIDGPQSLHSAFRYYANSSDAYGDTIYGLKLLQQYEVPTNILCVLNSKNAKHPEELYRFFEELCCEYIQFIPCIDPFEASAQDFSLSAQDYGDFLAHTCKLWYQDFKLGRIKHIQIFDEYVRMLLRQRPSVCGMNGVCTLQYVVEADGSVYPCDFYVLEGFRLGNVCKDSFEDIDRARERTNFLQSSRLFPLECQNCRYFPLCRCGCKRYRNPENLFCASYKQFFGECLHMLEDVAAYYARQMRA